MLSSERIGGITFSKKVAVEIDLSTIGNQRTSTEEMEARQKHQIVLGKLNGLC
jgi:hypothetical protein